MTYKPLSVKKYLLWIRMVGWKLEKGKIDWNLYNDLDVFICSIKIAHGKNTKEEVIAGSVKKLKELVRRGG